MMAEGSNIKIQEINSSSNYLEDEDISLKHTALLCCEVTDSSIQLPEILQVLYLRGIVERSCDALTIVLHVLMLEAGFCPKDMKGLQYTMMPDNWKGQGVYRILYSHHTCPNVNFRMTTFPMDSFLVVYGTVDGSDAATTSQLQLKVNTYINCSQGFLCASKVFLHLPNLSQTFKDTVAHCLLASAQNVLGVCPTFGLSAMMTELKLKILSYLKVRQLVAMSAVSKEFHELSNLPSLWRRLFLQDFPNVKRQTCNGLTDWKKMYKVEYLHQKRYNQLLEQSTFVIPGFHSYPTPPRAHVVWPSRIIGGDIDREPDFRIGITPEVESSFPNLSQRLQDPTLPLPSINPPAVPRMFFQRFF